MLRPNELALATKNVPAPGCSIDDAQKYTRWLATHHYENFNVVSWLLPKELHQHFYNVYAYCRWADDLGDEIPDGNRAVELLDWWERELERLLRRKTVTSRLHRPSRDRRSRKTFRRNPSPICSKPFARIRS